MIIVVTGTPGTGKTTLAKALATEFKYEYLDVNQIIDENNLVEKKDKARDTNIVDEKKLSKILLEKIEKAKSLVIDSHLSHYVPSNKVDYCIVTKCDLKMLQKRLENRGYTKEKIRENMDAEIFDICLTEASESGHNVIVLDTTRSTMKDLVKIVKNEISKDQR